MEINEPGAMERVELAALTMPAGVTESGGATMLKARLPLRVAPSKTATLAAPVAAISDAGTVAANCVPLTNIVLSGDPFQSTVAVSLNPLPIAVRMKEGPPATAKEGLKLDSD